MRLCGRIALIWGALALAACSDNNLDRAKARDVLAGSDSLPPVTIVLRSYLDTPCQRLVDGTAVYAELRDQGYFTPEDATRPGMFMQTERYCKVNLTDKGRAAAKGWNGETETQLAGPPLMTWRAPVGQVALQDVTGVTQAEGAAEAAAEFTWRHDPNELGKAVQARERQLGEEPAKMGGTGTATMRRYDDGWRVVSVVLRSAPAK